MTKSTTFRTLVVDDHPLMRSMLRTLLEQTGEFEIVGEAGAIKELRGLLGGGAIDVALIDVFLAGRPDGLSAIELLREHAPEAVVIVFSASDEEALVQQALALGASAYVLKQETDEQFPKIVRSILQGKAFVPMARDGAVKLTPREVQILRAITEGKSNRQIGEKLWISEQTVKFHLSNIYRKLGVSNRAQAVAWATQGGTSGGA